MSDSNQKPPEIDPDLQDTGERQAEESASYSSSGPSKPERRLPKIVLPFWAKLIMLTIVVFVASIGYFKSQLIGPEPSEIEVSGELPVTERRDPAPDVQLISEGGGTSQLSEYKGKVVLISFWAHWCAPCLVELPSFKNLHQKVGSNDFVVLPINLDEKGQGTEFITQFWKDKSIPFSTFYDPEKKAAAAFSVETLPSNFVLDRQGRVVMSSFGSNDWSSDSAVELIQSLLHEN